MLYRQRLASLLPSRLQAVSPETWRRHWRTILAVKVTGVIVSVALAVVLVPEARTRDLFVALTAGVYLPISFLLYLFQRRDPTPPNPVWIAVTLVDIAMVAAVQALFPRLSLAFPRELAKYVHGNRPLRLNSGYGTSPEDRPPSLLKKTVKTSIRNSG